MFPRPTATGVLSVIPVSSFRSHRARLGRCSSHSDEVSHSKCRHESQPTHCLIVPRGPLIHTTCRCYHCLCTLTRLTITHTYLEKVVVSTPVFHKCTDKYRHNVHNKPNDSTRGNNIKSQVTSTLTVTRC